MTQLLWLGPAENATPYAGLFATAGFQLALVQTVEAALAATARERYPIAVVCADWGDATAAIEQLRRDRPEVQVLAATQLGVPPHLGPVLRAGAGGVLDLRTQDPGEVVAQVEHARRRHERTLQERQLLVRLRDLNEEFLKNIVALEQRNLNLEEQLLPLAEADLVDDGDARQRLLIVDDETAITQLLAMVFGERFDVTNCPDGESALAAFQRQPFPLVITDKNLPGMGGITLMRKLLALRPETDVILITGYASKESAIEALNIGAAAYLEKPFDDISVVEQKVDGVLAKRQARLRKRQYLQLIKDRNRNFLGRYRTIRSELESWLRDYIPSNEEA